MATLWAGTSGFAYPGWKPDFYPANLPQRAFLRHYATRLNAVEINYTFRRLPPASTLENWVAETPAGFQFAIKAHQRITHIARLRPTEFTELFFKAIEPLRSARRLGAVLFQLPPNLKRDDGLLMGFLAELPSSIRYAIEFRHESWLDEAVYRQLRAQRVALCLAESATLEIPEVLTADFVYSRLRKPEYAESDRAAIAWRTRQMGASGRDLFVFFKHEESPAGALHAEELLRAASAAFR